MAVVEAGQLKGSFRGFRNRDTVFEFAGGGKWRQREYRYHYYYAYRPRARVIRGRNGFRLEVDGIAESVAVVRIR